MVERKRISEYAGNLSKECDRVKKEFGLAPKTKVILVEGGSFADMVNGKYNSQYNPKSYYGSMFSFWHEFDLPLIFMSDDRYS